VKFVPHDRDTSFTAVFDAVFRAAGVRVIRSAVQAPRMNSVMERWIGSCQRGAAGPDAGLEPAHLMIVLREYEDFCSTHRPHRTLKQAAPLRPLPGSVTDLYHFLVQRPDRAGGVLHEYHLVAQVFGTHSHGARKLNRPALDQSQQLGWPPDGPVPGPRLVRR
jgi:putative transposase